MIVTFDKTYLRDLYHYGKSTDKKHRYQPDIIKRYKRCVDYMMSAQSKEALYLIVSLHFEALHGEKTGLHSIRVNDQYRIEFTLTESATEPVLTICNIVELSNHYK